ncbi:WD40-repeat-containing domain protein [Phaeosphaeriaceae sp. PMI808]|nr:WD40-repeat-containing domain protein [Phaeosphaeriaceae sp. PMI808]
MDLDRHSSTLSPAQPYYILRGHASQIHSVQFVRQNTRLLTGDADGWVVYWRLESKRPLAVWKAHDGAILGTDEWGRDKFITVWQLRTSDNSLSTILPTEDTTTLRPKPWLLHTLPVNTLNFCSFSMCYEQMILKTAQSPDNLDSKIQPTLATAESILVATPATNDKKINVYQFPEEKLKYIVPNATTADTGMVMAVKIIRHHPSKGILVLAGYEGGLTAVFQLPQEENPSVRLAQLVYLSQPHTQPILSLDASPDANTYFTSSADAVVAAHRIPELLCVTDRPDCEATQDVHSAMPPTDSNHSEGETFLSTQTSSTSRDSSHAPEKDIDSASVAPATSLSFTKLPIQSPQSMTSKAAGLSSLLSNAQPQAKIKIPPPLKPVIKQPPYKTSNTKHAGQQSLRVRSDGRLFVTGGWDSRVRVYSSKTLKEVAVLKWHKEGVYAVDFARIMEAGDLQTEGVGDEVAVKETGIGKLARQREEQMQLKHLVAAGAKDGKVSLWEVF